METYMARQEQEAGFRTLIREYQTAWAPYRGMSNADVAGNPTVAAQGHDDAYIAALDCAFYADDHGWRERSEIWHGIALMHWDGSGQAREIEVVTL